eukprot:TRINITY_DN30351_c0_g2_i1.p1 TRINITY_DN30351_c0_g2~~TRINITY_DN30351_c0_g2_i1.p1  ORF type:complete len:767 (+),score=155.20 TRINITY_DN30351_c0_g2_i1:174-2303(+)
MPPRVLDADKCAGGGCSASDGGGCGVGGCDANSNGGVGAGVGFSVSGGATPGSMGRRARGAWVSDHDGGPLPERSARSAERYKEDCLRLKTELSDRRDETRQLQHRVRLLEGSLGVRMQQLEVLVEELRSASCGLVLEGSAGRQGHALASTGGAVCGATGDLSNAGVDQRRLAELLDRVIHEARRTQVVLHVHADSGARLEAKDRLLEQAQVDREREDVLKDQLAESQQETRRLAAKVRSNEPTCLRQKLDMAKRAARKQDELLVQFGRTEQDLYEKAHVLAQEVEDERRSKREHERTAQRLAGQLHEAKAENSRLVSALEQASAGNPPPATVTSSSLPGASTNDASRCPVVPPSGPRAISTGVGRVGSIATTVASEVSCGARSDCAGVSTSNASPECGDGDAGNLTARVSRRRQELTALRDEERALRRTRRTRNVSKERDTQRRGPRGDVVDVEEKETAGTADETDSQHRSSSPKNDGHVPAAWVECSDGGNENFSSCGEGGGCPSGVGSPECYNGKSVNQFNRQLVTQAKKAGATRQAPREVAEAEDDEEVAEAAQREAAACAALRAAFQNASARETTLREELVAAERRCTTIEARAESEHTSTMTSERLCRLEFEVVERQLAHIETVSSEAHAEEVASAQAQLSLEIQRGERQAWTLAEVANELAWQADMRQLASLQRELEMQRELQQAELRCAMLTAVANGLQSS